jgi:pimeloyl-ACP methyl ester carboxylesterase
MAEELSRSRTRVLGFSDGELDFQLLRQLGSTSYGGASVGESLFAAAQIRDRGQEAWPDVFAAIADSQRRDAEQRAAAGHRISARDGFLKASNSYRAAEYFAPIEQGRHTELGLLSRDAFRAAMQFSKCSFEPMEIVVDGQRLSGYWFAPTETDNDRLLVAVSGFDGTLEETYLQVGAAALQRGWRVLLVSGHGQMDTIRLNPQTHFVPDPERWISSWLDVAVSRPGVAASRLALVGISFGGYFALRAAAVDYRIAAVIPNSPVVDLRAYLTSFVGFDPESQMPAEQDFGPADIDAIPDDEMPPAQKEMSRSLIRRFGQPSFRSTFTYLQRFNVDPALINCPALAMVGEGEGPEPLRQFERFAATAGGPVTRRMFTANEGGDSHCQIGNLSLANAVIFDWLEETLR